jgi:GNAT superfamily N-acetyltransferase
VTAGSPQRLRMLAALAAIPAAPALPGGVGALRPLDHADVRALGRLAFRAYRGSVDDHGESEAWHREDMRATLAGRYGACLDASRVVEDGDGGLAAAAVFTLYYELPLLAFCLTDPAWRGRGIATHLIASCGRALEAAGHREMHLAVTDGNPARALYERLGFRVVPVPTP